MLPVVMGAHPDDYKHGAPLNSYIHVDDFTNVQALVDYLTFLASNNDEYNKYFEWKGTGELIDLKFFCTFCGMLHYADVVPNTARTKALHWSVRDASHEPGTGPCLPTDQYHWNRKNEPLQI